MSDPSQSQDGSAGVNPNRVVTSEAIRRVIDQCDLSNNNRQRQLSKLDYLEMMRRLTDIGAMETLETMLPACLQLQGQPYTLKEHFPFSPLYRITMPSMTIYKTGRQVAKSTNLAAHGVMLAACIPYFRTLYVTPLYEQIRRFSNNYVRPFIDLSPLRGSWLGTNTERSVLQRSFRNQSNMIFSFALMDADRVRGISADKVAIDEIQDMDPDHLPIIKETMAASKWGIQQFTGTPKSLDNPIEGLWRRSSQAEWFVPCYNCGEWNIPCMEFHVDAMIGPYSDDIGPNRSGLVCHKCRKPIDPRPPHGHWVHRYPERRKRFAGYHIPQIIMPMHCFRRDKWAELLAKREGWGNTPINVFYNEVLGESVDAGQKLITETELQRASILPWENTPNTPSPAMTRLLRHYRMRVLSVDWGGGGEDGVSFTTLSLLGFTVDGKIHVLWGKRLLTPNDHMREAREIMHWVGQFGVDLLSHDYTGAGIVRETILVQAGYPLERLMPIQYVRAASRNLITFIPPTPLHQRAHYSLDKTRSLLHTFQAIKLKLVQFFKYDYVNEDSPGLTHDFLALVEEKTESRHAGDLYTITRSVLMSDDFAQSVNIGCAAIWHANNAWPNFAEAAALGRITREMQEAAGSRDYGWEEDRTMRGFMNQP